MGVSSLDWEDLWEKEMATHSSFLVWESPWTEGPGWLQSVGSQNSRTELTQVRAAHPAPSGASFTLSVVASVKPLGAFYAVPKMGRFLLTPLTPSVTWLCVY